MQLRFRARRPGDPDEECSDDLCCLVKDATLAQIDSRVYSFALPYGKMFLCFHFQLCISHNGITLTVLWHLYLCILITNRGKHTVRIMGAYFDTIIIYLFKISGVEFFGKGNMLLTCTLVHYIFHNLAAHHDRTSWLVARHHLILHSAAKPVCTYKYLHAYRSKGVMMNFKITMSWQHAQQKCCVDLRAWKQSPRLWVMRIRAHVQKC